jgi:hypothetical protein
MLQQWQGISVGQSVGLYVANGPPRGIILQIRKPNGNEHVQVLVALIWERSMIKEDAHELKGFTHHLNKVWPKTENSFKFMVSTEFRVLTYDCIRDTEDSLSMDIEDSLCPHLVYHRPYTPRETRIREVGDMTEFFTEGAPFGQIKFGKSSQQ